MTLIKKQLFRTILVLTFSLQVSAFSLAQGQGQRLEAKVTLSAGMHNIVAEVAKTPREREIGLMYRKQMAPHEGMIFVFDEPATQCFWMRNTYLPLSTAFVADDGTVVNIEDMQPQTDASHCSTKPVRYVLEMNQGWFAKRGIKPGFKIKGSLFR
ncbi:MAG: DUF192 domain-containing protein [Ideonella sp. MAG2]|nr:MAG: DUF192 domain-containing protein [Ideonella sp. MAG2]